MTQEQRRKNHTPETKARIREGKLRFQEKLVTTVGNIEELTLRAQGLKTDEGLALCLESLLHRVDELKVLLKIGVE
jgi:hypothetical protein